MNIRVTFPGGQSRDYPAGTAVSKVAVDPAFPQSSLPVIAALLNNEVVSFHHELAVNCRAAPVDLGAKAGIAIYRRSLCLLLAMAVTRAFPKRRLIVGHSLGDGYFYHFAGMETIPRDDLLRIEAAMREIVAKDMPIRSLSLSYGEAIEYFEKHNQPDTLLLLKNRNDPAIAVHSCDGFLDLSHGPLVPSTGALSVFALLGYPPGFVLRYPPRDNPMHLGEFV